MATPFPVAAPRGAKSQERDEAGEQDEWNRARAGRARAVSLLVDLVASVAAVEQRHLRPSRPLWERSGGQVPTRPTDCARNLGGARPLWDRRRACAAFHKHFAARTLGPLHSTWTLLLLPPYTYTHTHTHTQPPICSFALHAQQHQLQHKPQRVRASPSLPCSATSPSPRRRFRHTRHTRPIALP
jgi:hypothetical protein